MKSKLKTLTGRTLTFQPDKLTKALLERWAAANPNVAWSFVVNSAIREHLKQHAGKRYAHLLES